MEQIGNNRTNLSKLDVLGTDLVFVRFSEDVGLGCGGGTRRMPTEVATFREPSMYYCEELYMRLKASLCTKESSETIPFFLLILLTFNGLVPLLEVYKGIIFNFLHSLNPSKSFKGFT